MLTIYFAESKLIYENIRSVSIDCIVGKYDFTLFDNISKFQEFEFFETLETY